jgi:fructose-1,6-bisphosphatase II
MPQMPENARGAGGEQAAARPAPDHNLALDLVRATEAAAMAAGRWVGRGDKNGADQAAVDAMRAMTGTLQFRGVVVIGEGEKDEAPMLYNGEVIGSGEGPACDVAVDPVEGTALTAKGMNGAISVMAVSARGSMFDPSALFYMDKLVAGAAAAGAVDLRAPVADNVRAVAKAKGGAPGDVTVCLLDKPRHADLAREVCEAGARLMFIPEGDVAGAVLAARDDSAVDLLLGTGGTPEGVIAACAVTCLGGVMQGRLRARDAHETRRARDAGYDLDQVFDAGELVRGDDMFFVATGITDGDLLHGVRYRPGRAVTESLVMRARSGTVRQMRSEHNLSRLSAYSAVDYLPSGPGTV